MPARSSGSPLRPIIVCAAAAAARAGSARTGAVRAVLKNPGAIALHVMPCADQASAMARVSCASPPLLAPYGALSGNALADCSEVTLTMRPNARAFMPGASTCVSLNGAARLSARVKSQSASRTSMNGWRRLTPAALTRMSTPPLSFSTRPAASRSCATSVRSAATAAATSPSDRNDATVASSSRSRRATSHTAAPARARARAIASPSPELPPVTSARRSSSENSDAR